MYTGNKKPRELCLSSADNKDHPPPDDLTVYVNPASDFHGFQKHLLTRKIETIPLRPFYCNICTKLDVERQFLNDYRLLEEKIGLSRDEITLLGQRGQPTHCNCYRSLNLKRIVALEDLRTLWRTWTGMILLLLLMNG